MTIIQKQSKNNHSIVSIELHEELEYTSNIIPVYT